jgi:hypothetical protein
VRWGLAAAALALVGATAAAQDAKPAAEQEAPEKKAPPEKTPPAKDAPAKKDAPAPKGAEAPKSKDAAAPPPAPEPGTDLWKAVKDVFAGRVHGEIDTEYRARWTPSNSDQDIYQWATFRLGDELTDLFSANVSFRSTWDLDGQRNRRDGDYEFVSLADTYDKSFNTRLYTAYGNLRPEGGPIEEVRFGRQFVYEGTKLRAAAYTGVPVHLYESSTHGDWLAGLRLEAEPRKGTRTALDYVHVNDDLDFGKQHDSFVSLQAWQNVTEHLRSYARTTYLGTLRDVELRTTSIYPEHDLTVLASYYRLFAPMDEYSTEFDEFFPVLYTLEEYQTGDLRLVKGFGDHFVVETGASIRDLVEGGDNTAANHDTTRVFVSPTVLDWPLEGSTISLTYDRLDGDGTRIDTWSGEFSQVFDDKFEAAVGTSYDLWKFGPLVRGERTHVRAYYGRLGVRLSEAVRLETTYSWEADDEETFQVFTFGVTYVF